MDARAEEHVLTLKRPFPAFFSAAALFLDAALRLLNLRWPFLRLPPTKRTFLAFFFFRFFFFFLAFFFFFFFFLAFGFLAFFAFFAFGFFAAFFDAFFFFAAVFCTVRARVSLR